MKASKARRLRALIEGLTEYLVDADAVGAAELFPQWKCEGEYSVGQRIRYGSVLYRCLLDHQAQPGWDPADAPSLWGRVLMEEMAVIPEWVQPNSTNPYAKGDRVRYMEKIWESICDRNVWEPGMYGWEIVE